MSKLNTTEVQDGIALLPLWTVNHDQTAISRNFTFSSFVEAFEFMTKVAAQAESINHHPDWSNVYNRVSISLSTHHINGLSQLDLDLAHFIDTAALIA